MAESYSVREDLNFSKVFFCPNIKNVQKRENINFLFVGFKSTLGLLLSSRVFLSGIKMGVNVVCTLVLTGKHDWRIS